MAYVPKTEAAGPLPSSDRAGLKLAAAKEERELVLRAQRGDASAYEELVRVHQQRVLAVVGGILRRREDAEDVAQQAFAKAYFSLRRFDLRSAFGTWLYKIAVNECWDYLRKKKVRRLVYESDLSEDQLRQMETASESLGHELRPRENTALRLEQRQLVDELLGELGEKDRLMLVMKEVEGFSVEEISEVLGLNVNTVKVRLFRARGRLVELHRRRHPKRQAGAPPERIASQSRQQ
ncbi:MAG TPA: sigma-70 family RNA polymerase sigma factor [Methylomirabilota bacterium]|nr:sigma-70 family RNA polymerase sigma factor [Methylomirabilota bacterium]